MRKSKFIYRIYRYTGWETCLATPDPQSLLWFFSNTDWRGYHLRDANNQIFQSGLIVFKRKLATTFHVDYEHKRLI